MPRSDAFRQFARSIRMASFAERNDLSTRGVLDLALSQRLSRRSFVKAAGATTAAPFVAGMLGGLAAPPRRNGTVAIVGAGLAGLVCADRLRARGMTANLYEASDRVGGRCSSLRGFFPGQTAELGGEFIDTTHQTMRQYATEFGLAREDVTATEGEIFYRFGGALISEEAIVDEYRILVPRIRDDVQQLSGEPSFFNHTATDEAFDQISLAEWLDTRCADLPLVRAALDEAYVAEYGLECAEQSCLNLLFFLHADRRRRFTPFGVFSDERFHLVGGNDAIATHIAARLPGTINLNRRLVGLSRLSNGRYSLDFAQGPDVVADHVVLTLPFTVLRTVALSPSLGLSADKRRAIDELGYGLNAKTMIGFTSEPWRGAGCSGSIYSDLPNLQTSWETNAINADATRAILTDYAGGDRGGALGGVPLQQAVGAFLGDLDAVIPGAAAAARRSSGNSVLAARAHWPSNSLSRGSYTCYRPGQFTGVAGLEAQAAGRVKFAGEHTDSFYSWQGFMEGACLSGLRAADEVLDEARA
ncbi:MAG: FAD-dependent oxidoreductase [Phycisphaerales bacterium]